LRMGLVYDESKRRVAHGRVDACAKIGNEVGNEGFTKLGAHVLEVLGVPVDIAFDGKEQSEVGGRGFVLVDDGSVNVLDVFYKVQENVQRIVEESGIGGRIEEDGKVGALVFL